MHVRECETASQNRNQVSFASERVCKVCRHLFVEVPQSSGCVWEVEDHEDHEDEDVCGGIGVFVEDYGRPNS